jgi:hypothetical protein
MMPLMQKFMLAVLVILNFILPVQAQSLSQFIVPLINSMIHLFVLTLILYMAGALVLGGSKAKLSRAFAIALIGELVIFVLNLAFLFFVPLYVSLAIEYVLVLRLLLSIIVWLALIKSFYKTGWLGALAVAILAVIIMLVLEILLTSLLIALKILL